MFISPHDPIFWFVAVCGPSQRPTAARVHLVRRVARLSSDEHDPAVPRSLQDWTPLPLLLPGLHLMP